MNKLRGDWVALSAIQRVYIVLYVAFCVVKNNGWVYFFSRWFGGDKYY